MALLLINSIPKKTNNYNQATIDYLQNLQTNIQQKINMIEKNTEYLNKVDRFTHSQAIDFEYNFGKLEAYTEIQKEISQKILDLKNISVKLT